MATRPAIPSPALAERDRDIRPLQVTGTAQSCPNQDQVCEMVLDPSDVL